MGPELLGLLQKETNTEVRERLYQALDRQEEVDPASVLELAKKEPSGTARVAALNLLAGIVGSSPEGEPLNYFQTTALPELKQLALGSGNIQEELASVLALGRSGTPEAISALNEIAQGAKDARVVKAAQAAIQMGQRRSP